MCRIGTLVEGLGVLKCNSGKTAGAGQAFVNDAARTAENLGGNRMSVMPTVALSMIVKNAARDLPECLASVRGGVSEIVVADTGSTDDTAAIAQKAGARVISVPWENDFSKARNFPLELVTADWVLSLDADERLDPGAPVGTAGVAR